MALLSTLEITLQTMPDHIRKLSRQRVAHNRNNAYTTHLRHRQANWIIPGNKQEVFRLITNDLVQLVKISGRLFNANDVFEVMCQSYSRFRSNIAAGTAGYIIQYNRKGRSFRYRFIMLVKMPSGPRLL